MSTTQVRRFCRNGHMVGERDSCPACGAAASPEGARAYAVRWVASFVLFVGLVVALVTVVAGGLEQGDALDPLRAPVTSLLGV